MENLRFAKEIQNATEIATIQNYNLKTATEALKNITHGVVMGFEFNGEKVGVSLEDRKKISDFVTYLETLNLTQYQVINEVLKNLNE